MPLYLDTLCRLRVNKSVFLVLYACWMFSGAANTYFNLDLTGDITHDFTHLRQERKQFRHRGLYMTCKNTYSDNNTECFFCHRKLTSLNSLNSLDTNLCMVYLRNNSWKLYVYIVFTTGRPLCHEVLPRADIKAYPW
jgi:hypothetical protein